MRSSVKQPPLKLGIQKTGGLNLQWESKNFARKDFGACVRLLVQMATDWLVGLCRAG